MNRDDVLRLAREAEVPVNKAIERFAQAAYAAGAAAEREACAKVCEQLEEDGGEWDIQQQCANAIRARSNT